MKHRRLSPLVGLLSAVAVSPVQSGVLLGAHAGAYGDRDNRTPLVALEQEIGRKLAIDNDHEDWMEFPNLARIRWNDQNGRLSMLSWRINFNRERPGQGCATADAISSGVYDAQLKRQATALKSVGHRVLVRFNYEMTNSQEKDCFTGFPVKSDLAMAGTKYVRAWKHVVDAFRAAGATNVEWVWAPGQPAYRDGSWRAFFPGSAYVDWMAVDDYNRVDAPRSFASDPGMAAFYAAAAPMGKPMMISETGAVNDPGLHPDPQTVWLTTARQFLKSHPAIKAFLWWNEGGKYAKDHPGYGGSGYVLQGAGLAAFRDLASDPYFR